MTVSWYTRDSAYSYEAISVHSWPPWRDKMQTELVHLFGETGDKENEFLEKNALILRNSLACAFPDVVSLAQAASARGQS